MTTSQKPTPSLKRFLIGPPLPTEELAHQSVSRMIGLAVFASDALSSTAYATEEILLILVAAGTGFLSLSIPIAIAITFLLIIVTLSYRQTIHAYPNGGGAYIVARDNLGELPAQVAAAALLTDYILTVAVSISSGTAQIASAIPALLPYRVEIAVSVIILITIINLRGVKESGRIFAAPTYFFLGSAFLLLIVGSYQYLTGHLSIVQGVQMVQDTIEPLTWFLILRAFSSGCTALTGIEAISNGIMAFKEPKPKNAAATLTAMSSILVVIFLGFTLLANHIGAVPSLTETVISQMARTVFGTNIFYFAMLLGTALILLLAANTSYADFPRLAALVAGDGFLPRQLMFRGSRLVYTYGITGLGGLAILLVVFFNAQVSGLIPLYAIGVFLSFTMSQSGMVVRARKMGKLKPGEVLKTEATTLEYDAHWKRHMLLSGTGAVVTGIVMVVFAVTKFAAGAWFILLLIPCLVYVFLRIHEHYRAVADYLSLHNPKRIKHNVGPVSSLLLIEDVHAGTLRLVDFAKSACVPWKAIHIAINPAKTKEIRQKWAERVGDGELVVIPSPYRQIIDPLRKYVKSELAKQPQGYINVIMGHLAMGTVWEQGLHQNSAVIFNLALQNIERVVVTTVPYQIYHLHYHNGDAPEVVLEQTAQLPPTHEK